MAQQIPLVEIAGQIKQLPTADILSRGIVQTLGSLNGGALVYAPANNVYAPAATQAITTTDTSTLFVWASIAVFMTVAPDIVILQLAVDGTQIVEAVMGIGAATQDSTGLVGIATAVAAGVHTVTLDWKTAGNAGTLNVAAANRLSLVVSEFHP